jgi:hypothetical protein
MFRSTSRVLPKLVRNPSCSLRARFVARGLIASALVLGAVGAISLPSTVAQADIRQPGTRTLKYGFSIDNAAAFAGYTILAFPWSLSNGVPTQEVFVVKTPNPVPVGRWGQPEFYAIRTAVFDEERTKGFDPQTLEKFFKDNPQVVASGVKVDPLRVVAESEPIVGVEDVFTLVECNDKKLVVKPKLVRYTYKDGGLAEIAYPASGGARPKAPASAPAPAAPSAAPSSSSGAAPPPAEPPKAGCGSCVVGREEEGDGAGRAFLLAAVMIVAGGAAYSARRRAR